MEDKNNNNNNENNEKEILTNGIFISGLPYETTEDELKDIFKKYGEITEIKLPKYQDSGKNIGYCHIYFSSKNSAKNSLEMDHNYIGKRYITVELANLNSDELKIESKGKTNSSDIPTNCLTCFIKNLPYDITEKEVGDKFRACGKIKAIRFVYNSKNKNFKGFCFIDFIEHKSLLKALELNGKLFKGRKLIVDYETNKPKKGYKYNNNTIDEKYNKEHLYLLNRKRKKNK